MDKTNRQRTTQLDILPERPAQEKKYLLSIGISTLIIGLDWGIFWLIAQVISPVIAGMICIGLAAPTFTPLYKQLKSQVEKPTKPIRYLPTKLRTTEESQVLRRGVHTGGTIGGYKLEHLIGRGGMSEVYMTQSGGLMLAVKIIDTTISPEYAMRFEREVSMLKMAKHPNVVQVFDSGVDDDLAYMVMEYIQGINLKDYIAHDAPLATKEIVEIVQGIASALDHMHALGIVHRDLKPGNIMLYWDINKRCIPMLLDFGVAKQSSVTVITLEGTVGTVEYMSPEQILEAPMVQSSSDVYAIGVIVYEMLTGQLPYDGSMGAIVFGHLHGEPRDPREIRDDVPNHMAEAVIKAMAKDPHERFSTLSEFAQAITKTISTSVLQPEV